MIVGILVLPLSIICLVFNEARAVRTANHWQEARQEFTTVSDDVIDPRYDGKPIHVAGTVTTPTVIRDSRVGVEVNAMRLIRLVHVFESTEDSNGNREGLWVEVPDSQDSIGPVDRGDSESKPWSTRRWQASDVGLGAFQLRKDIVAKISIDAALDLTQQTIVLSTATPMHIAERSTLYIGADPNDPALGDLKIQYLVTRSCNASILGRQFSNTIQPYQTSKGGTVYLIAGGIRSKDSMFDIQMTSDRAVTWVLRGLGVVLMVIGFLSLYVPLGDSAKAIPSIGRSMSGSPLRFGLIASMVVAPLMIGVTWLMLRAVYGVPVLTAITVAVLVAIRHWRGRKEQAATVESAHRFWADESEVVIH